MPQVQRDLAGWVEAYARQGWHRTGSAVDRRCALWLVDQARRRGLDAELAEVPLTRVVQRRAALSVQGHRRPGVVLFDSNLPDEEFIDGDLGPLGSAAAIGVTDTTAFGADPSLDAARHAHAHRAIVAVTHGQRPGLALRNTTTARPFGPPVLQLSARYADALHAAAAARTRARLEIVARRVPARALNVEVWVGQRQPGDHVVLSPRSGWWTCAAERGGGLACWLDVLRGPVVAAGGVRLVATTGHELGQLGLAHYLAGAGLDPDAIWVHLGANIGARGGRLAFCVSDAQTREIAEQAAAAAFPAGSLQRLDRPVGEAADLAGSGRRFVSLVGTNARFHQRADRYPDNVDVAVVARASALVRRILAALPRPHDRADRAGRADRVETLDSRT